MSFTNWNIAWVNKKTWQFVNTVPTSTAWSFTITDRNWTTGNVLLVTSATTQYWVSMQNDWAYVQLPSFALAWTFWAWACGTYHPWSNTITATWWSTTTITTTAAIDSIITWATIRFLSWTAWNIWSEVTITNVSVVPGWTSTITFTPAVTAVANADTFAISSWRYFIKNAGTTAAWIFKSFDIATWTITSLWTTNLPATWWTDWRLVATPSTDWTFATGTATAWASTTLTNSAKTWTTNQWTNYQIRITGGTGKWQVRTIASNTWTVITVSSAWWTNPDATSTYSIEWNDDYLYLLGNNAVTMYRYSISWNTWTAMAPTTARAAAPIAWMSANWVWKTWNADWANESNILDWRYIYSFRWWASTLDRFDIAWGTWWAWAWKAITYNYANETFSAWSSYDVVWGKIYIRKDATNRFFYYDIPWNNIFPFSNLLQTDWIALLWDKLWTWRYTDPTNSSNYIDWLYSWWNSSFAVYRTMIF